MKKIAFHTLGCKVNQVDTEGLIEDFSHRGYEVVDFHEIADIYVINSCTVTHVSDRKSRAMVREPCVVTQVHWWLRLDVSPRLIPPNWPPLKALNWWLAIATSIIWHR